MTKNLYLCKDLHLNKVLYCFEADSDAVAVRAQAPIISRMIPLGDSQLIYIGSYDTDTNKLILMIVVLFLGIATSSLKIL